MLQEANLAWRYIDTESNLICPWYVLPCLEFIKKFDTSGWSVFESGAGYSTIWWRLNCKYLLTVESDENWCNAMGERAERGQGLWCRVIPEEFAHFLDWWQRAHTTGGEVNYTTIDEWKPLSRPYHAFDCIIIDGIEREKATRYSLPYLKAGGFLIIDNYDSENYNIAETEDLLKNMKKITFKQPTHSSWVTAVFQKV